MKKIINLSLLLIFTFVISSCTTKRTVVVREPAPAVRSEVVVVQKAPPAPKTVVVKRCGPNKIWISGHWKWNGRKYVWKRGHCERKRKNKVWVAGHWSKTPRGWKWTPGHWR